ncbi:odorant receptor 4-like isoform X3 [Anoplolepis gracilipes]|uniref:odorant receptor 4-like isoform X3 n=1 Tax=Anoplolepis gracilipes TaxID=354296 RepID=UPI003B9E6B0A
MHVLPVSFALLTYTGYWRPVHFPVNSLKYWMYNLYSAFMFVLLHLFTCYGIVDTFVLSVNLEEFVEKCYLFLSIFGVSCKIVHLFIRRGKIIDLDKMLLENNCIPRDMEEKLIQERFDRHASVAHETLISGMMIQTCAQFEILCHRAHILPMLLMKAEKSSDESGENLIAREKAIIRDLINHHLYIYKFAYKVNATFTTMIFIQFALISLVLCMSVYKLSTMTSFLSFNFAHKFSYLCSMLMQIFLYCWYGNEVTLKSIDVSTAIYEMDWTKLKVGVMKELMIIMMRADKPITMSSGYIITLSTESFMSILKISYSAYNFLKDV